MRKLTLKLKRCSDTSIVDGDERKFADSGEHLRKGTRKFDLLRAPLDVRLFPDDILDKALLLEYSTSSNMASINGGLRSSGDRLR
jgi:hypothetical protein